MMTSWCHFTVQLHILDDRASMTEIHLFAKENVGASSYLTEYQNEEILMNMPAQSVHGIRE